ncbi:MAG: hypothetical protein ACREMV_05120 [Gemmatimonadales bacterium]
MVAPAGYSGALSKLSALGPNVRIAFKDQAQFDQVLLPIGDLVLVVRRRDGGLEPLLLADEAFQDVFASHTRSLASMALSVIGAPSPP